jgi:benzoyl-CoA 2,3-epoxidase subunit A
MDMRAPAGALRQHLIDPEICIRCNTCEATCPIGAITHDDRNYVVKPDVCNMCLACVPPCPTGAIDNWRTVPASRAYSIEDQLSWDALPSEVSADQLSADPQPAPVTMAAAAPVRSAGADAWAADAEPDPASYASVTPPWSAAHPYTNLYGPKNPVLATVVGNVRVNAAGTENETHHIVLDFGPMPFPVLEGQSIGIVPPGTDAGGRTHHARQYSVASPRNGERAGYNNLSLTVKRVTEDRQGKPVRGVCSNYLCDLSVGESVQVIGPFGATFLMPNHPGSHLVMICTGTGSAPMRGMTEWRRRLQAKGRFESGRLMLFFGARTQEELPYFGPLMSLPKDFIDINLAFSRTPGQPKRYVQDAMRERAVDLAPLLKDAQSYLYLCGVRGMEKGVLAALRDIAQEAGLDWPELAMALKREGRLHIETY